MKKYKNFINELYTNPFNPDEVWENKVKFSEMNRNQIEDFIERNINNTIIFTAYYYESGIDEKIGPVVLKDYEIYYEYSGGERELMIDFIIDDGKRYNVYEFDYVIIKK